MHTFFARLGDSRSVAHGAVSTGALTALAFVNPRTLTPGKRLAYRATLAGLSAWTVWTSFRQRPNEVPVAPEVRVAVTTVAAGTVMGVAEVGEMLDAAVHDGLVKRGVKKPRLWLATATAVLGVLTWYLERKSDTLFADITNPEVDA